MTLRVGTDFAFGQRFSDTEIDISEIFKGIETSLKTIKEWPVDGIIDIFDEFSRVLLDRRISKLHDSYPNSGIPFIANWCRGKNLSSLIDAALGSRGYLDGFVDSSINPNRAYRAYPRGVAVHWMAGNVPTLGFLSLIQGILTKNGNIIKVASASNMLLSELLCLLSGVRGGSRWNGLELTKTVAVIRYDHNRTDIGSHISKEADIRVIWGGDESVKAIKGLPAKLEAIDVIFPNKTSFIAIGKTELERSAIPALTKRIARDISVFEQKACASPHTIFIETGDEDLVYYIAQTLGDALISALERTPRVLPSQREISNILTVRAKYDMFHKAIYSKGTEFTILIDDLFMLGPPIGNRCIYIRKVDNLSSLAGLITSKVQTVAIAADNERYQQLTGLYGAHGVQRFVRIGGMTNFESPWDGFFLPQHLVRWTSKGEIQTYAKED